MEERPRVFVARAMHDDKVSAALRVVTTSTRDWEFVEIPISDGWQMDAIEAIRTCHVFVFISTRASRRSKWCRWELRAARTHQRPVLRLQEYELKDLVGMLAAFRSA